jgi:hypothetical protein
MNRIVYDDIIKLLHQEIKTGKYAHKTFEDKFWIQVNKKSKNECWTFLVKLYQNGYGCFRMKKLDVLTHRISFLLEHGYLPSNKNIVMYTCDNRSCVNPNHLMEGSNSDNILDMVTKGRGNYKHMIGLNNPNGKISEKQKLEIIKIYNSKNKITLKEIAILCNVTYQTISRILKINGIKIK